MAPLTLDAPTGEGAAALTPLELLRLAAYRLQLCVASPRRCGTVLLPLTSPRCVRLGVVLRRRSCETRVMALIYFHKCTPTVTECSGYVRFALRTPDVRPSTRSLTGHVTAHVLAARQVLAAGCIYLAIQASEANRKLRDVVNVCFKYAHAEPARIAQFALHCDAKALRALRPV